MEIEQSFTVPYPRDAVWAHFHDVPEIVACLPGASLTAPVENGLLKLAMTVKLGPIIASFAGDGEMTLDDENRQGSITGTGVDRKSASRVKGVAAFSLAAPSPNETRVDVKVEYTIGGSLAQFSRGGIVRELATRMTEAFADNLKARLDAAAAAPPMATPPIATPPTPAAGADAATSAGSSPPAHGASSVPGATSSDGPAAASAPQSAPESAAVSAAGSAATPAGVPPAAPPASASPSSDSPVPQRTAPRTPVPNAPLDVGNLFWKMLWARLRGMFGLGAR
ncbi:SRPBCC family protein [Chitinasiproducens palmae]|uniref:Carbon monoxide dehydrogenase subunit G n=1 Tax=Chitinasiproducens palmae TaxID=1770053 RepID=A0A1H2PRU7_9BURK|nr:SRPBCC family protein [Chitinasiproducens palmae]SDV48849.1 Carbon monoxide dehydrogenase subunit G [Chitinasiproducens palmae]